MEWIDLAQEKDQCRTLVNTVINPRVPQNVGKLLNSCTTGGLSKMAELHGVSEFPVSKMSSIVKCTQHSPCPF
jgi:hypothetical protein